MIIFTNILLIASILSLFLLFLVYWWLVPKEFILSPLLTDSPTIIKIFFTFLLLGFNAYGSLIIERLASKMTGVVYNRISPALNFAHLALNAISLVIIARLLLPTIGFFSCVLPSQIPYYFGVLALCTTVNIVRTKMAAISTIDKERFSLRHHFMGQSAHELMKKDLRRPILYLRSFNKELLSTTTRGRFSYISKFFNHSLYMYSGPSKFDYSLLKNRIRSDFLNTNRSLLDEQLIFASFFSTIGPYIAIGRPGETFGTMDIGAAKMYVTDDEWQSTVLNLLKRSAAIVLEAGDSDGLLWEIEQVITFVPARKLLIVLPTSDLEHQAFRSFSEHIFPKSLPKKRVQSRLLMFEDDWTPIELENINFSVALSLAPFCRRNGFASGLKGMEDSG